MRLLSKTKILIGQYGAGMTNMIFMNDNSTIIEIQVAEWTKEDYCTVASLCQHRYLFFSLPKKFAVIETIIIFHRTIFTS